jgi:hypothetical protein
MDSMVFDSPTLASRKVAATPFIQVLPPPGTTRWLDPTGDGPGPEFVGIRREVAERLGAVVADHDLDGCILREILGDWLIENDGIPVKMCAKPGHAETPPNRRRQENVLVPA